MSARAPPDWPRLPRAPIEATAGPAAAIKWLRMPERCAPSDCAKSCPIISPNDGVLCERNAAERPPDNAEAGARSATFSKSSAALGGGDEAEAPLYCCRRVPISLNQLITRLPSTLPAGCPMQRYGLRSLLGWSLADASSQERFR